MKIIAYLTSLLFFFLLSLELYSDDKPYFPDEFKPEKMLSFTDHLITTGEYYRAYVELQRLQSYHPDYISPLAYNVTRSFIFYKSSKYEDVIRNNNIAADKIELCVSDIFIIDSLLKTGKSNESSLLFKDYCDSESLNGFYKKRKIYISILDNFNNPKTQEIEYYNYKDSAEYADNLRLLKKSPVLGGAAGLIPGMGYIYAGETGTGIVAFLIIAAGSVLTYGAKSNGLDSLAVFSGAATFFMYTGNIAGGYMQTVKYNRKLSDSLILRLDKDFMLDKDLDELYLNFGIKSNVR